MNRNRTISIGKAITVTAVIPFLLHAFSGGPDPRLSGAPGEQTADDWLDRGLHRVTDDLGALSEKELSITIS